MEQELKILTERVNTLQYNVAPHLHGEISKLKETLVMWRDDMTSMLQTWQGQVEEICNMLTRIRELKVQLANGVESEEQRQEINNEIFQILEEITCAYRRIYGSFNAGEWPSPFQRA